MIRITCFLSVLCVAGCGGGGGSGGGDGGNLPDDAHVPGDGSNNPTDAMQLAANDLCANATVISLATMHADVPATTFGAHAELAAPCAVTSQPDVFFKFTLTRREVVYADTFGAGSNTTLYFASSCATARTASTTPGDAVCSAGACGTQQSQVAALLDPGTHYLVYAGDGAAMIHFQHSEVGSGSVQLLAQGASVPTGTTSGSGLLYACEAAGAENAYWWMTCPSDVGGTFTASTCTGTNFDTILSLQMPGTENVMCDDDTCSVQSTVSASIPAGAGMYVVAVDGFSAAKHGDYTLTVSRP